MGCSLANKAAVPTTQTPVSGSAVSTMCKNGGCALFLSVVKVRFSLMFCKKCPHTAPTRRTAGGKGPLWSEISQRPTQPSLNQLAWISSSHDSGNDVSFKTIFLKTGPNRRTLPQSRWKQLDDAAMLFLYKLGSAGYLLLAFSGANAVNSQGSASQNDVEVGIFVRRGRAALV